MTPAKEVALSGSRSLNPAILDIRIAPLTTDRDCLMLESSLIAGERAYTEVNVEVADGIFEFKEGGIDSMEHHLHAMAQFPQDPSAASDRVRGEGFGKLKAGTIERDNPALVVTYPACYATVKGRAVRLFRWDRRDYVVSALTILLECR